MAGVRFWCAVPGCASKVKKSSKESGTFYRFLNSARYKVVHLQNLAKIRLQKWMQAIPKPRMVTKRVCAKHFVKGFPAALTHTNDVDWTPTLHLQATVENVPSDDPVVLSASSGSVAVQVPAMRANVLVTWQIMGLTGTRIRIGWTVYSAMCSQCFQLLGVSAV
nr:uncharacterized protein LOC115269881 [Aedes albopictus]